MTRRDTGLVLALILGVSACASQPSTPPPVPIVVSETIINDPARPAADRANDARRKTIESLTFMQVRQGYTILDMEAGSGFWSEILARATGQTGKVIMQNPRAFEGRLSANINTRLAGGRLPNVSTSFSSFDALTPATASVDMVTWIQGPHELYFTPPGGTSLGDPAKTFQEVARVLKPGGSFIVIDHSANRGAPATTGQTLHRIDPAITIANAQAAGFDLVDRGLFLSNPADNRTKQVFDTSIRGNTDQHVLRFVKR